MCPQFLKVGQARKDGIEMGRHFIEKHHGTLDEFSLGADAPKPASAPPPR